MADEKANNLEVNSSLGHYRIVKKIGAGGMGEVYLAEDAKLGRKIALKILPAQALQNADNLRRFEQEARAASALNHPNIAHIYEIGESGGVHFISMEFVEGESLSDKIGSRPLPVSDIFNLGAQIADALDEAHEHGITHRDIKSANVMLTKRGRVKVLDFGLAKISSKVEEAESEADTRIKTKPGVVMGTVSYMSPEQALGRETDARTDIWSLGVILYEMATGRLPFGGESLTETIDKIAHAQPEAIARFNYEAPPELEIIIKKALRKKCEERYQSAHDILVDLQTLAHELDLTEHSSSKSSEPSAVAGGLTKRFDSSANTSNAKLQPPATAGGSDNSRQIHTTSSAEYIADSVKKHKTGAIVALLLFIIALAGIGYGIYRLTAKRDKPALSFQTAKFTRLTTTGKASGVAISPDGKYVVHVQDDGGQQSLWMRQVATQSNVQIVAPAAVTYDGLIFSPDGNYIYYRVMSQEFSLGALFQLPTLGGAPKKLLENLGTNPISFSPDGKQIAFSRMAYGKEDALMIANADGTNERKLVAHKNPPADVGSLAWSPDGKSIAYNVLNFDTNDATLYEAQVADGSTKPMTAQRWLRIWGLSWLSDGSGLVMLATPGQSDLGLQIWQISYPEGEAHRLTNDLNHYSGMSLTADSGILAVVQSEWQASIWIAPVGDASRARPVTSGSGKVDMYLSWTPDGRIVYGSNAGGNADIWITGADGTSAKQLTANARINRDPAVSPDGRYIVFFSDRTGVPHLWRMNIDGSDQRQLTNGGSGEWDPQFSPDGRWLVYITALGKSTVWKIPADGGEPVQLTDKLSSFPTISPDGKLVAYFYRDDNALRRIAVAPLEGGEPLKTFDGPALRSLSLRWTPDGRAVAYIDTKNGISNIVAQPLDGGATKQLTDFKADRIFSFAYSRDGKQFWRLTKKRPTSVRLLARRQTTRPFARHANERRRAD